MGLAPLATILLIAIVAGLIAQAVARTGYRWEWLNVAAGVAFGAYFFSEAIPAASANLGITDWGPQWDGFFLIPAIVGGVLIALILDVAMRREPTIEAAAG